MAAGSLQSGSLHNEEKTMNEKVCCNCRHNIRKNKSGRIECECEITKEYIGYIQCMNSRCRHWAKEKKWEDGQTVTN